MSNGFTAKNILVLESHVPFSSGGAEVLIGDLVKEIKKLGHNVDVLALPFLIKNNEDLLSQICQWRQLDLAEIGGRRVDMVIATKFPTYFANHPNKIVWMIHQHRQAYDLYGTRYGDFGESVSDEALRNSIFNADRVALNESKKVFTISDNVSRRLKDFLGIESEALEPPLPSKSFLANSIDFKINKGNSILVVGRICSSKRVELILRSLPEIDRSLNLVIVGTEDEPGVEDFLRSEIDKHDLQNRVRFMGKISDERLIELYSDCFCVFYGSYDEDYGYVTFEAAKFKKPIVTTHDSGHVHDIVAKFDSGIIATPDVNGISEAVNLLLNDSELYQRYAENGDVVQPNTSWEEILKKFLVED